MRRLAATREFREGFAEMLPACIGLIPFGLVCGVGAAAAGANWFTAIGMSAIIFSGAAQILAAQLLAAGAPLAVIILTCFVLGLRFLMYSAAMAPYVKPLSPRWQKTIAFLLTDQAFAASIRRFHAEAGQGSPTLAASAAAPPPEGDAVRALGRPGSAHAHAAATHFLGAGAALWIFWQATNLIGFLTGNLIPAAWSLEFAVPLCFLALLAPLLRNASNVVAAVAAGVAVLALAGLPMRLNLIVAGVLGIATGTLADFARERWTRR